MLPGPKGEAESLIANSSSGTRAGQSSARSPAKERKTSAMTPLTRSTLLVVLRWCGEPKMGDAPTAACRPECASEACVAIRHEHVGQPQVAKHRRDQVASLRLGSCGLEGRDQPHAPGHEVYSYVHLQKVVAAGDGQLEEVQAEAPAAERGGRQGVQQAGRRQLVCLDALTRRAGAHVLLHRRRQAWPPRRTARQGERLVAIEVPAAGTQRRSPRR